MFSVLPEPHLIPLKSISDLGTSTISPVHKSSAEACHGLRAALGGHSRKSFQAVRHSRLFDTDISKIGDDRDAN